MNSNNFFSRIFWDYIYSGREWTPVESRQVSFINGFSIIGISASVGFGIYRVLIGEYIPGGIEIAIGTIGVFNVLYLRKSFNSERAGGVLLSIMVVMIAFLFVNGGIAGTGLYWAFTFPVLAFFLFDDTMGLRWNVGLLFVLSVISLAKLTGIVTTPYDWIVLRQAFFSFMAVVGLLYFYTKFTGINARILAERTQKMETIFSAEKQQIEEKAQVAEKSLKDKLDNFFQTAGDLMCLANSEGYFIEINPAFTKILGYTPEELLGTPFVNFVHPDDKEKTKQTMDKLNRGELVENFTNRYMKKDGTYTWFMWNATPHNGTIYALAHPVSGLMETQEELEAKLAELEKLNRLMINRELMMIEMKRELKALKEDSKNQL